MQERVFRSIEAKLGKHGSGAPEAGADESEVDDLAARAASLEERITARVGLRSG
jgi:hypothetical protein